MAHSAAKCPKVLHNIGMFIDAYAIIVQKDGDGGDSLHREGLYAFGKWLYYHHETNTVVFADPPEREDPKKVIDKFEVKPGIFVRHPDPNKWSSNYKTTSRDQMVPLIAYCGAYQDYPRLWRLFKATASRGFFAQNLIDNGPGKTKKKVPDTMLFHLGLFIRAGGPWTKPLYPLLFVTDTLHLAGTLLHQIPIHWVEREKRLRWKEMRDTDDNNTLVYHLMALSFKPTPISWLDRQIYAWTRRENYGNTILKEENKVMGAMAWYHRPELGGNPEIAEIYRPVIERYFSPQVAVQDNIDRIARIFRRSEREIATSD